MNDYVSLGYKGKSTLEAGFIYVPVNPFTGETYYIQPKPLPTPIQHRIMVIVRNEVCECELCK